MGHLPVITNVYRCTLNWGSLAGVAPHNVMHVGGLAASASDVGEALAAALDSLPNLYENLQTSQTMQSIDVLPLDGTSPTTTVDVASLNIHGSTSGAFVPESAIVCKFGTAQRGSRGRGRIFLGPTGEAAINYGLIDPVYVSEMQVAWDLFQDALDTALPTLVHVVASYAHADAHTVTDYTIRNFECTQRRRLLQLR